MGEVPTMLRGMPQQGSSSYIDAASRGVVATSPCHHHMVQMILQRCCCSKVYILRNKYLSLFQWV